MRILTLINMGKPKNKIKKVLTLIKLKLATSLINCILSVSGMSLGFS